MRTLIEIINMSLYVNFIDPDYTIILLIKEKLKYLKDKHFEILIYNDASLNRSNFFIVCQEKKLGHM